MQILISPPPSAAGILKHFISDKNQGINSDKKYCSQL